jgi:DNA ligase-1
MTTFRPMLAASEAPDLDKLHFPLIAQPKFDGIRCTVLPELGPVTRTIKPIKNDYIRNIIGQPHFLHHDGEIVTYDEKTGKADELNTVQSKVMSKDGEPHFVFHTFDHVEALGLPYVDRHKLIVSGGRVDARFFDSLDELAAYEDELVANGWEGAILRDPDAAYKLGRSTLKEGILLKMKRFYDSEATVTGFVEQMTNTNEKTTDERGYAKRSKKKEGMIPAGTLGALEMEWANGVKFEIGTGIGLTKELRLEIWNNQAKYLGKPTTFKYQRLGPNGAPLLPVFRCFRDPSDLEQAA